MSQIFALELFAIIGGCAGAVVIFSLIIIGICVIKKKRQVAPQSNQKDGGIIIMTVVGRLLNF